MRTVFLCVCAMILIWPVAALAEIQNFDTDKTKYSEDDTIFVSGKVDFEENHPFIIIRVLDPSESDLVFLDQISLSSNGNFKTSIIPGGPKWTAEGPYAILVTYAGHTQEKIIQFSFSNKSVNSDNVTPKTPPVSTQTQEESKETITNKTLENLRDRIPGFPSVEKSPSYYIHRYDTESSYREWFDSQFHGYTIQEVVNYPKTHIPNFPDNSNPPSYYIHRYETESSYREWFDSQFPDNSIYSVLGFSEKQNIPDWVKMNAKWWSTEKVSDDDFVQGLEFLIDNKIIRLQDIPPVTASTSKIPEWVKNVAGWWSDDMISEDEFIRSLKFLIEQGIVIIN